MRSRATMALALSVFALSAAPAHAAGPPIVLESWVTGVTASGATLRAKINPNGSFTRYRFQYITEAAYEANLKAAQEGFGGAKTIPAASEAEGLVGGGTTTLEVHPPLSGLTPATSYRYRVVAKNENGAATTIGPEHTLATQESSLVFQLPDQRAWELVSPTDKGGGAIATPGSLFGGGEFQAAEGGGAVTYSSASAFDDPKGAPPASQYLSTRTSSGWSSQNVSTPLQSASYGDDPDGAPYRLFSTDLARALLLKGTRCFAEGTCPPSYAQWQGGSLTSVPSKAGLSFEGASPDLHHLVFSADDGLYAWSGGGLQQLSSAGAALAAPISAVSENGSRTYLTLTANLYLREGGQTTQVDESLGGGGSFQGASADGSTAFFTKAEHLYRFKAATKAITDLTPSAGVKGVLGVSSDGSTAYFQDGAGIQRWREGTITPVAAGAQAAAESDYEPPTTGTSRVSADGSHLAFLSEEELSDYDNGGETEAYLYGPPVGGGAPVLRCASCNPTGERAEGSASIPAALPNGSTTAYLPRALSSDGQRLFFTSSDDLVVQDTNERPDVYEWEAKGKGDCNRSPGCVNLISSGRSQEGATFIDASSDGSDVFFTTDGSLVGIDPGSIDLYDARVGGGFPEAPKPIPCVADACQALPAGPEDPDPGTLIKSSGNPSPSFETEKQKKRKKHHKRRHHKKHHHHSKGKAGKRR